MVLLTRDEDSPRWSYAKLFLEEMCHRTGIYPQKKDYSKAVADYWDSEYAKHNPAEITTVHRVNQPEAGMTIVEKNDGHADDRRRQVPMRQPPARNFRGIPVVPADYKKVPR